MGREGTPSAQGDRTIVLIPPRAPHHPPRPTRCVAAFLPLPPIPSLREPVVTLAERRCLKPHDLLQNYASALLLQKKHANALHMEEHAMTNNVNGSYCLLSRPPFKSQLTPLGVNPKRLR